MGKTHSFRSVATAMVEKPVLGTGYSRMAMEFDVKNAVKHTMEIGLSQVLRDRTWKMSISLSAMITFALFALIYGILRVGVGVDFTSDRGTLAKNVYFISLALFFVTAWILFALRFGTANMKKEHVEKERGAGSWKLVEEKDWEHFYRLWKLAREKEEKDLEEFKNKLATKDRK